MSDRRMITATQHKTAVYIHWDQSVCRAATTSYFIHELIVSKRETPPRWQTGTVVGSDMFFVDRSTCKVRTEHTLPVHSQHVFNHVLCSDRSPVTPVCPVMWWARLHQFVRDQASDSNLQILTFYLYGVATVTRQAEHLLQECDHTHRKCVFILIVFFGLWEFIWSPEWTDSKPHGRCSIRNSSTFQ